jgi:hypothetical protein
MQDLDTTVLSPFAKQLASIGHASQANKSVATQSSCKAAPWCGVVGNQKSRLK